MTAEETKTGTHFIDTEVEQKEWDSWADYDTYCANGERVFEAICDEAALYKIASEAVKKKLDSLNAYGKFYKEQYDKARDKIAELTKTIQDMGKAQDELKKRNSYAFKSREDAQKFISETQSNENLK